MTLRPVLSSLALTLSLTLVTAAPATDWPVFHGPDGSNKSPDTGLLREWPDGGPELAWQVDGLGEGYATVSVADGLVYTSGNKNDQTMVIALDLEGNVVWQKPNGGPWTGSFPGTRGTPTIDGDRLYHESPIGNVICMNAKTGEEIWSLNILDKFAGKNIKWALAESVIIDGPRAIVCPFGDKASIVALDKMTGEVVWTSESTGDMAGYSTPALFEYEGLRMVVTMNQKAVVGVDADSGKLLFRHPHETKYDVNALLPVFHDGQIFVASGYGSGAQMIKLTVEGKNVSAEQVWENKKFDNHHGGVILQDGFLYGTNFRGQWMCVDWKTGETKWSEKGIGKGSVSFADGLLYGFNERQNDRTVGLIKPNPEAYEEISRFQIPEGGKGNSWAHPVIIGGRLYLRHGDFLFVYDVEAK